MYLSFYNLKVKPFQMSTDPDFLWLGEQHKEALATLKYAIIENKGILALTGDVGTGKTTLINALIQSLGEDTLAATIYDPSLGVLEFFNVVASAFNMGKTFESKGRFIIHFRQFLKKARERKQKVLLIIDEAQAMEAELLEEIRLLSNLEQEHIRLLNIFFVGQNEFVDILQEYRNRALRQRITIRYHIEELTLDETEAYIRHRLRVSGTEAPIFSPGAMDEIFAFSGGYPRLINIICDHALLSGYVQELDTIHANTIRECREELLISRKSSKYPVHDQGITLPEAPAGAPVGGPGMPEQEWEFSEQSQRFSGRDTDGVPLERDPEPVKGRRMPTFLVVVLLAAIGAIAGYVYFQDGTNMAKPRIFSVTKPKEVSDSMKTAPTNDTAFVRPPKPESLKKTAPIKGEPLDAVPPPRFADKPNMPSTSEKTGVPVILALGSGSAETAKAATPAEDKTSGAVLPDRSKKTLVAASAPDKTSDKISTSASKPAKTPVQPKTSETAQQDYGKRVEKPAAVKPAPKPVQTQKDPSHKSLTAAKKLSIKETSLAGSSVFSKKPATGQAASSVKPPAAEPETVAKRTVSQYNLQDRLKTFLRAYCRTYERKNLDMFSRFFAPDALEQGRPFKSWASQYRKNFNKIDSMIYNIDLERYATQDETGEVRIEGTFQVRAKLSGSKKWRKSKGRISMVVEPFKDSFRVKELNY
jgi:type II secretory pathway predicted ATPase ExeA